ncbi:MAG: Gfo/Idh/MocA family oxidoreductase [Chloroflexota bacterium]
MTKTIRWGMIGAGDVTEVKSGPGFQKAKNSALVAVMRRNGALAKDYAERHSVARWYDAAEDLINDSEVDAIYIATPPHVHKKYTLMCADAGKPVYVEKPMALTYNDCQEMFEACRSAGVSLWVAYYRRLLPRFLKVKTLLESGIIGKIRAVTVAMFKPEAPALFPADNLPWRVVPEYSGGGLFVDVGSHTLDFLDYVLGPIQSARGIATNQSKLYLAEDSVSASFIFASGVIGTGIWCFSSDQTVDQVEIVGTKGKVSFASFSPTPIVLTTAAGKQEFVLNDPPHVHQPLIQTIVDELNGEGVCPSTGESGARTSWVIDQILSEYRMQNSQIVQ